MFYIIHQGCEPILIGYTWGERNMRLFCCAAKSKANMYVLLIKSEKPFFFYNVLQFFCVNTMDMSSNFAAFLHVVDAFT